MRALLAVVKEQFSLVRKFTTKDCKASLEELEKRGSLDGSVTGHTPSPAG